MLDIGVSEILSNQERGKRIDRGHLFPPRPPPCLLATHSSKIFTLDEMWTDLVHLETFIIFFEIYWRVHVQIQILYKYNVQ